MLIYTKKRHPSFTQEGCLFFIYQYTDCLFAGTVVFRACKRRIIITGGVDDLLASGYDHIRRLISGITKEILMQLGHIGRIVISPRSTAFPSLIDTINI